MFQKDFTFKRSCITDIIHPPIPEPAATAKPDRNDNQLFKSIEEALLLVKQNSQDGSQFLTQRSFKTLTTTAAAENNNPNLVNVNVSSNHLNDSFGNVTTPVADLNPTQTDTKESKLKYKIEFVGKQECSDSNSEISSEQPESDDDDDYRSNNITITQESDDDTVVDKMIAGISKVRKDQIQDLQNAHISNRYNNNYTNKIM